MNVERTASQRADLFTATWDSMSAPTRRRFRLHKENAELKREREVLYRALDQTERLCTGDSELEAKIQRVLHDSEERK